METLTRGEAQIVVTDLKKELELIKGKIKDGGVLNTAISELRTRQTQIQNKLNSILTKGGLITEEDYNQAYNLLRDTQRKELTDLSGKTSNRMKAFVIILLGVVAYLIIKKTRSTK